MRMLKTTCAIAAMLLGIAAAPTAAMAAISVIPAGDPSGEGFNTEASTTQAGGHPDASLAFNITPRTKVFDFGKVGGALRGTVVDLPPGFVGNPAAVEKCSAVQIRPGFAGAESDCPPASQVGFVRLRTGFTEGSGGEPYVTVPLYALETNDDQLASLGFKIISVVTKINASLRPGDYGIRLTTNGLPQIVPVSGVTVYTWGVPLDASHDQQRCHMIDSLGDLPIFDELCGSEASYTTPFGNPGGPRKAFLSNPSVCDNPKESAIRVRGWYEPGVFGSPPTPLSDPATDTEPTPTGCNQLEFEPSIEAKPTTNLADAPSGLDFTLHIPQNEDPDGLATAHLRDAVVILPEGMTVNPSSADGLGACSEEQIALGKDVPNSCPDISKLGTVEIETPVLEDPVPGAIYLAEQEKNPFGSLLALYISAKLPNGQEVKIPGRAEGNPQTGQLTARFEQNPQLPFEDLHVNIFGGARGSLKTPAACGVHTTTSQMTPWSSPEGADAFPSDSFELASGPDGKGCLPSGGGAPNSPAFTAGTLDPTAAAYSPFVLKLTRQDGSQPIKGIDVNLPPGLTGKLAGIPYCSEAALASLSTKSGKAEQASSSCPASSQVGAVDVAAGAGPLPLRVSSQAYLAGPYKGAPLSMAIVTPAVAGPFDLGVVTVRTALHVDPRTAQIHAVSDSIPTILEGIPLNVRSISVKLDRPSFTLNPTSCNEMAITGSATSVFDQLASLKDRFQVGECARLDFKPKLDLRLFGGTKRGAYQRLRATVTMKGKEANIAGASVALPRSVFLAQEHIKTICTRVQFAADACPPNSVYGKATATTPLLDQPLSGPVYLRSSNNELPDLVADLGGQLQVELVGRIDTFKRGIRNTFDVVPDAPVSKFVLEMKGGKRSLVVNSRNLCAGTQRATAVVSAHNGAQKSFKPIVRNSCKGKKARKGAKGRKGPKKPSGKR